MERLIHIPWSLLLLLQQLLLLLLLVRILELAAELRRMILLLLVGLVLGVGPAAVLVEVLSRGGRLLPRHLHIVAINVQLLRHQLLA